MAAVMIGVDPHKASHTAVAISAAEEPLGELRVRACDPERRPPRRSRSRCPRAHRALRCEHLNQTQPPKTGTTRSVTKLAPSLNR